MDLPKSPYVSFVHEASFNGYNMSTCSPIPIDSSIGLNIVDTLKQIKSRKMSKSYDLTTYIEVIDDKHLPSSFEDDGLFVLFPL